MGRTCSKSSPGATPGQRHAPAPAATTVASTTLVQYSAATAFSPITGSGGVAPLSYTIAPALPVGLSMSSAGVISGIPALVSAAATYTVTITDANGVTATATFQLGVDPGLSATYVAVAPFSPVTGSGGAPPLRYSISPALPAGLTMSSTGLISGTPPAAGFNIYTVTVTDADGNTVTLTFRIIVDGALSATTTVASTTLTQNHAATPFMPVTAAGGGAPGGRRERVRIWVCAGSDFGALCRTTQPAERDEGLGSAAGVAGAHAHPLPHRLRSAQRLPEAGAANLHAHRNRLRRRGAA